MHFSLISGDIGFKWLSLYDFLKDLLLFYAYVCCARMNVCFVPHVYNACVIQKQMKFPGTGAIDRCEMGIQPGSSAKAASSILNL